MLGLLRLLFVLPTQFLRSRRDLLLENLALRQQLAVLRQCHPQLRFGAPDKLFWVMLRRLWPGWKRALILVQAGDRRSLASGGIQVILEVALAASESVWEENA